MWKTDFLESKREWRRTSQEAMAEVQARGAVGFHGWGGGSTKWIDPSVSKCMNLGVSKWMDPGVSQWMEPGVFQ